MAAGVGSFLGGFAKGLSGEITTTRERRDRLAREEAERKSRLGAALLPHAIENAETEDDLADIFSMIDPEFGAKPKGQGAKAPSTFEKLRPYLGPFFKDKDKQKQQQPSGAGGMATVVTDVAPQQAGAGAPVGALPAPPATTAPATAPTSPVGQIAQTTMTPAPSPVPGTTGVPALPGSAALAQTPAPTAADGTTPQAQATVRTSRFGIEVGTKEQKAVRNVQRARAVLKEMKTIDPSATMDDAFRLLGITMPIDRAALAPQSIAGEVVDPKTGKATSAFGVFDRATGKYLNAETGEPMQNFRPRTTTGSTSMGTDREALARSMFGTRFVDLDQAQQQQVMAQEQMRAGQMAETRGRGTGAARIATELQMPIGATAAQLYNVPPTTTLAELQNTITISPAQREKINSLAQVDTLLTEIETLVPKVFPNVKPGVWGRLQSQFSLGLQKAAADEDYVALESAISAALAQVAQLSGQPGSRLSDTDLKLAQATLAQLTPQVFGGDTLKSAQARLGVLRRLFEQAQGNVVRPQLGPGRGARRGAAPAGAGAGTGLQMDAAGNILQNGTIVVPVQ